jgi:hypothetical protein
MADVAGERASLGALLGQLSRDVTTLARQEVVLAKTEASEKVSLFGVGIASLIVSAAVLLAGLIVLLMAAVYGLMEVIEPWLAALIVGAIAALIGLFILLRSRSQLKPDRLTPRQTIESLRQDWQMIRERLRGRAGPREIQPR